MVMIEIRGVLFVIAAHLSHAVSQGKSEELGPSIEITRR